MWDASQAYGGFGLVTVVSLQIAHDLHIVNNRYDLAAKNTLVAAGGTGFTYPACSAPAYSTSGTYTAGNEVSYQGYVSETAFLLLNSQLLLCSYRCIRYIWEVSVAIMLYLICLAHCLQPFSGKMVDDEHPLG